MKNGRRFDVIAFALLLFQIGCHPKHTKINLEGLFLEGNISIKGIDTIYEGPINYYDSNNVLLRTEHFKDNKLNGKSIYYFHNGVVEKNDKYVNGLMQGPSKLYDSTGKIVYETNYYYDIEMGPRITYEQNQPKLYLFESLDGLELYRCKYESDKAPLESGKLLNYVTTYYMIDDKMKLSIFLFLIKPYHKKVTYKIFDKNLLSGDSTMIYLNTAVGEAYFERFYLDPPKPNHSYLWDVETYYPNNKIKVHNVLDSAERKIDLPHSRDKAETN